MFPWFQAKTTLGDTCPRQARVHSLVNKSQTGECSDTLGSMSSAGLGSQASDDLGSMSSGMGSQASEELGSMSSVGLGSQASEELRSF